MWLPDEPSDEREARGEPEVDSCRMGISPLCTDEGAYLWQGEYCCAHCFSAAERSWESAQDRHDELLRAIR